MPRTRYGIGEWYGREFLGLTPEQRRSHARAALETREMPCPFAGGRCSKRGGVCSIREYDEGADGSVAGVTGPPVIVCPVRFHDRDVLVRWLAEIVGFEETATRVATEVPFMVSTVKAERAAGKIDLVIAAERDRLEWHALEVQAVYFSGDGMEQEFRALLTDDGPAAPFPVRRRRPDWRSSSAKRLAPQLEIKGPSVTRWQAKLALAVDRAFLDAVGGPSAAPRTDLDSGDVIWLVPEFSEGRLVRGHWEILTLRESVEKLLAARPTSRAEFESQLRAKLRSADEWRHFG